MSPSSKFMPKSSQRPQNNEPSTIATYKALSFIFGLMFLIQCLSGDLLTIVVSIVPAVLLIRYGLKPVAKPSSVGKVV